MATSEAKHSSNNTNCRKKLGFLLTAWHTTNQLMHRIRSYSTEIIGLGKVLKAHVGLGFASCYMTFSNFPSPNNIRRILAPVH